MQMEADSCEIEEGDGNHICKIESLQPIGESLCNCSCFASPLIKSTFMFKNIFVYINVPFFVCHHNPIYEYDALNHPVGNPITNTNLYRIRVREEDTA